MEKYKSETGKELDLKDYERIADQGARLGAIAITILGGEPLLYEKLSDLISVFSARHYFVNMVTNGILLTKNKLEGLKSAGLNSIYFSLDSMNEEANDKIRGRGHFRKVMANLEDAKDIGLITGLCPVFFPGRIQDGIDVIEFCTKHGYNASGGQVAAVGLAEHSGILSPAEHDQVRNLLKKYSRLTFDWSMSYFLKQRCPGGKEKIGITNLGDVIGCSVNPISFGNVLTEPLAKIWARMGRFSQFSKDSSVCLTAEDRHYIDNYLAPAYKSGKYPLNYDEHPMMTPDKEPTMRNERS